MDEADGTDQPPVPEGQNVQTSTDIGSIEAAVHADITPGAPQHLQDVTGTRDGAGRSGTAPAPVAIATIPGFPNLPDGWSLSYSNSFMEVRF